MNGASDLTLDLWCTPLGDGWGAARSLAHPAGRRALEACLGVGVRLDLAVRHGSCQGFSDTPTLRRGQLDWLLRFQTVCGRRKVGGYKNPRHWSLRGSCEI